MDLSEVIMDLVINETLEAEVGGQWPLSCFSPIKGGPCFPDMQDYSPEEIRWRMYEANKNGTLAECQRQIKELYKGAKQKRNYLKKPSRKIYAIIDKYYVHKVDVTAGNPAFSVDSTKATESVFGSSAFGSSAGLSKPQSNELASSLYTPKEELTEEELSAFSADAFTIGKVPTRPPPRDFC